MYKTTLLIIDDLIFTWQRFLSLDDCRKFPDYLMILLALGQPAVALERTLDVWMSVFHLDLQEVYNKQFKEVFRKMKRVIFITEDLFQKDLESVFISYCSFELRRSKSTETTNRGIICFLIVFLNGRKIKINYFPHPWLSSFVLEQLETWHESNVGIASFAFTTCSNCK